MKSKACHISAQLSKCRVASILTYKKLMLAHLLSVLCTANVLWGSSVPERLCTTPRVAGLLIGSSHADQAISCGSV